MDRHQISSVFFSFPGPSSVARQSYFPCRRGIKKNSTAIASGNLETISMNRALTLPREGSVAVQPG